MRIIAGTKRGMRLFSPQGKASRPIIDRVKESLFSVLYQYALPEGAIVADLFCGIGSLGLEALSRGARFVTFVEKDPQIKAVLEKNIRQADLAQQCRLIIGDAFVIGAPIDPGFGKYNLVFVDPPYALSRAIGVDTPLALLMSTLSQQVTEDGLVVIRTEKEIELPSPYGGFILNQRRVWGTMAVTLLKQR